jgi:hypothetical protein
VYLQTRVLEQYIVIGGVLLCFTPLFFSSITPFVVPIACYLLAWITFGISPKYIRFSSQIETIVLLSILYVCTFLAIFDPFEIVGFPLAIFLYLISLELLLRTVLFEFMIRKGFQKTIPLIFVNVLYVFCGFFYTYRYFENFFVPLLLMSISVVLYSILIVTSQRLWWQLLMSILLTFCFIYFDVQRLLTVVLSYLFT